MTDRTAKRFFAWAFCALSVTRCTFCIVHDTKNYEFDFMDGAEKSPHFGGERERTETFMKTHSKSDIELMMLAFKKRENGRSFDQIYDELHGLYPQKIANKRQIYRYLQYANRYIDHYKIIKQKLYQLGLMEYI